MLQPLRKVRWRQLNHHSRVNYLVSYDAVAVGNGRPFDAVSLSVLMARSRTRMSMKSMKEHMKAMIHLDMILIIFLQGKIRWMKSSWTKVIYLFNPLSFQINPKVLRLSSRV